MGTPCTIIGMVGFFLGLFSGIITVSIDSYLEEIALFIGLGIFAFFLFWAVFLYFVYNGMQLTITDKRVYGLCAFKKRIRLTGTSKPVVEDAGPHAKLINKKTRRTWFSLFLFSQLLRSDIRAAERKD